MKKILIERGEGEEANYQYSFLSLQRSIEEIKICPVQLKQGENVDKKYTYILTSLKAAVFGST